MLPFTGERLVPGAADCEPTFGAKMYHEHVARYRFAAQLVRGNRVLDVGCGTGYGSALLADAGAAEVVAFDVSSEAIEYAKVHFSRPSLEFHVASAEEFDFGRFDVVTCFELIEHVEGQEAVLDAVGRALLPEGFAFISTPRPREHGPRSPFHVRELGFDEFSSLLERRFGGTEYWFEVNQLGSRIDVELGSGDADVTLLQPEQFRPANADYFLAVVGHHPLESLTLRPTHVVGDDAYVLNLEQDVAILRDAEQQLLVRHDAVVAALTQANQEISDKLRRAERGRERAESRRAAAERHAQAMTETLSWRVTAPLRVVRSSLFHAADLRTRVAAARERRGMAGLVAEAPRRLVCTLRARRATADQWSDVPLSDATELEGVGSDVVHVVFLIGSWEGQSKRYRVGNIADGLRELGFRVLILDASDAGLLLEYDIVPDCLVLFRATLGGRPDELREIFRLVRRRGGRVIGDFDDLVFDPAVVEEIDGFRALPESARAQYVQGVLGYRELILELDLVLCPTASLADRVRELGVESAVVRNSLDSQQLAAAAEPEQDGHHSGVVIGYFSGTPTHQRDFEEAAAAIERVLDERPETRLLIVGHLDLPGAWRRFGRRVEQLPFMPYVSLLRLTKSVDINIAPLVVGNAFCEAKSELKIFEAGVVGVPTVASATDSYARAIDDAVDGLLADSPADWHAKLDALAGSSELRERIGAAARERALTQYTYRAAAEDFIAAVGLARPSKPPEPAAEESGRTKISWIVPGLIVGGGGHRNILRAAHHLERLGYDVQLYFTEWQGSNDELNRLIHEHFYVLRGRATRYTGSISPCDVLFATHWSTVKPALDNRSSASEVMYFVQDFEPFFYPMGSEYLLAENTYREGLYHITSGPWCERVLRTRFAAMADHFQFPIDTGIYFRRARTDQRMRVLYFAKPEMPRRCFTLGVEGLRAFHRLRPDVEIVLFGSTAVDIASLGFPARLAGLLDLDELAELYSNSDLGVVFSPTNPSLVPYEMMACGLPVVDLNTEFAELNYGDRSDIALLVDPDPAKIATQMADLLADRRELRERSIRGEEFAATFPTEEQMAARIAEIIEQRLESSARPTAARDVVARSDVRR